MWRGGARRGVEHTRAAVWWAVVRGGTLGYRTRHPRPHPRPHPPPPPALAQVCSALGEAWSPREPFLLALTVPAAGGGGGGGGSANKG